MSVQGRTAAGLVSAGAALSMIALPTPALADDDDQDAGGTTTVVLNQPLVSALLALGVAPVAPGTLSTPGGIAQVAFPITEVEDDEIEHSGGLTFTKAKAGVVTITRFEVDTEDGELTARTMVNGTRVGRRAIFDLGPTQAINSAGTVPACAGVAAGLTLTPFAGGALGVAADTFIGDACVVPVVTAADDDDDDDDD